MIANATTTREVAETGAADTHGAAFRTPATTGPRGASMLLGCVADPAVSAATAGETRVSPETARSTATISAVTLASVLRTAPSDTIPGAESTASRRRYTSGV